jgi:uncharacterized protein YycO
MLSKTWSVIGVMLLCVVGGSDILANPVTAARDRAKNELKEKERELREAGERKASEAKEAVEREAREAKEAAEREARKLREAREAAKQKAQEAERKAREAKEDVERKAQEAKERIAREVADAAEKEGKLREAAELLKREAPARLAEHVKDELKVIEAAGERLAKSVKVETEETLESIKRSKSIRAAAVEFDKRRIDALNDFSEQSKRAGKDFSDDAKKAGAIVSNTWKMYNADLDRLHGWLRANARVGDIVACGNIWNGDCGEWGHIAIVTDPEKELLYESVVGDGVHETEWATLAKHYVKIALYRVKNVEEQDASRVVEWVKTQDGKPYRMPITDGTDKNNDNRMYCSQLIWIAYKRTLDIDLHGNSSPIIHPDEMLRSPNMILQKKARKW